MKARGILLVITTLSTLALLVVLLYQNSWIAEYQEAEPLFPLVQEFGSELAGIEAERPVTGSDIEATLSQDRFEDLRSYGVVFPEDDGLVVTIKVNRRFSFDIKTDGNPVWRKH